MQPHTTADTWSRIALREACRIMLDQLGPETRAEQLYRHTERVKAMEAILPGLRDAPSRR
jgi:hypothetical protein